MSHLAPSRVGIRNLSFRATIVAAGVCLVGFLGAPSVAQDRDTPPDAQSQRGQGQGQGQGQDRGDRARGQRGNQREDQAGNQGRGRGGDDARGGERQDRGGRDGDRGNWGGWNRGNWDRGNRGESEGTRGLGLRGTPDGLFTPDYMTRDVPKIISDLELDDTQRAIISQLFEDYDLKFREKLEALQAATTELRDSYEPDAELEQAMEHVREGMRSMRDEMRARRGAGRDGGRRAGENQDQQAGAAESGQEAGEQMSEEARRAQSEQLHEEIRARFGDLRTQMQSVREKRNASTQMQAMLDARVALVRDFAAFKKSLRDSTTSSVQVMLMENQIDDWESIDRMLRRQRVLRRGRLSGESTDVLDVFTQQDVDPAVMSTELTDSIIDYETELNGALKAREDFDYGPGLDLMEHIRDLDFASALSVYRSRLAAQERIRNINDRHIDFISSQMPDGTGDAFRMAALQLGYRSIFRPTRGERALSAAMEIEDLEPDTIVAIADLMQGHMDEIAMFNEDLLLVVRSDELSQEIRRAEERMDRFNGNRGDRNRDQVDPTREAFGKRTEIDDRYLASLKNLLGATQYESIAGRRGRGGRDGGGGFSREDFIGQFDKDGDGELNADERQAARDAMRERFREGRGGQQQQPREL